MTWSSRAVAQALALSASCAIVAVQADAAAAAACTWTVTPTQNGPSGNPLFGVSADSATDAWATGYYNITPTQSVPLDERWNGSTWTTINGISQSSVQTVMFAAKAFAPNNVWTIGYFQTAANILEPTVQHWNGAKWTVAALPLPGGLGGVLQAVAATAPNDLWAFGIQFVSSTETQTLIEHFNGTKWSIVPSPNVNHVDDELFSAVAITPSDAWAGGYFLNSSGIRRNMSMHWNGTKWSLVPIPSVGNFKDNLLGMAALATNAVFALGNHKSATGPNALAEGWNGSAWSVQMTPNPSGSSIYLGATASPSEGALGVGEVNGSLASPLAAVWNGTKWVNANPVNVGSFGDYFVSASTIPGTHNFWATGVILDGGGNFSQSLAERYNCP